jgi:hypothetical protein
LGLFAGACGALGYEGHLNMRRSRTGSGGHGVLDVVSGGCLRRNQDFRSKNRTLSVTLIAEWHCFLIAIWHPRRRPVATVAGKGAAC